MSKKRKFKTPIKSEKIRYKDIATAIILAINAGDISYEEFKKAQEIIDNKFSNKKIK